MKEIEVQTENDKNEIVKNSVIKIDENSDRIKVIVSVGQPREGCFMSAAEMKRVIDNVHNKITKSLEENSKIITIPHWVKINTIKI